MSTIDNQVVKSRLLISTLLITLVFEGILRKLAPNALSIGIFFFKDLLCLLGLFHILNSNLSSISKQSAKVFKVVIILMYPLLLYNLFIDPILILWGAKLYLLYFVIAILMTMAFPPENKNIITIFSKWFQIIIVITVVTGLFQLTLSPQHWLNRSVAGGTLEAFSAAGQLRISSTFSFTGQYSYFLVFASSLFFFFFFFNLKNSKTTLSSALMQIGTIVLLIIGGFSTGGKSAVLGIFVIIVIGALFIILRNPFFALKRLTLPLLFLLFLFPVIQLSYPEYFAAYTERSNNRGGSSEDILVRVIEPFSNLINSSMFGKGLGVMTNGADKVSAYAASIRFDGTWTESDFATIIWEGGFYLVMIWYGFRLYVIFYSFRILCSIKDSNYYSAASFLFAYILVQGLIGTLTIQPPIAIYLWISFGGLISIQKIDEYDSPII